MRGSLGTTLYARAQNRHPLTWDVKASPNVVVLLVVGNNDVNDESRHYEVSASSQSYA